MPELDSASLAKLADEISKRLSGAANNGNRHEAGRMGGPRGNGGGNSGRAGDWMCKSCGHSNFSNRSACRSCGSGRPGKGKGGGKQRPQQQAALDQSPTTRRTPGGKGLGGRPSGGVSAGKSYLAAAREPARLAEFIRPPGAKAANLHGGTRNSSAFKPRAGKANWFDLSVDDADTVVAEPMPEGARQAVPASQSATGTSSGTGEPAQAEREELQQQIQRKKKLLKYLEAQGFGADDKTVIYEKAEVERITSLLDEDRLGSPPSGSKLDRAERQLRKAQQARAALDDELKEIEAAYDQQLDLIDQKYKDVDARIALHTASVKRIKAQLGGPAKVPKRLCEGISNAIELLGSLGPTLGVIFEAAQSNPKVLGEGIDTGEQMRKISAVYDILGQCDNGEWPTESSDSEDEDDDEDDDEEDEEEEDDDEELVEEEDGAPTDAQPAGGSVAMPTISAQPGPAAAPPSHPSSPPVVPGPSAPNSEPDPNAQQQPQQPPQPVPAPRDGPTEAVGGQTDVPSVRNDSPAVQAARERKRSMAQVHSKHEHVIGKGKAKLGKQHLAGGATAPIPAPEPTTDMQIED